MAGKQHLRQGHVVESTPATGRAAGASLWSSAKQGVWTLRRAGVLACVLPNKCAIPVNRAFQIFFHTVHRGPSLLTGYERDMLALVQTAEIQLCRRKVAEAYARLYQFPPAGHVHLRSGHLEVVHVNHEEALLWRGSSTRANSVLAQSQPPAPRCRNAPPKRFQRLGARTKRATTGRHVFETWGAESGQASGGSATQVSVPYS